MTMRNVLVPLSALLIVVTLVSLIRSDAWFVRTVDLVREPVIYSAAALLILAAVLLKSKWRWISIALLMMTIVINIWRVWPYSALAPAEMELNPKLALRTQNRCFSAMSVNVKVENARYDKLIAQLRRIDPDLLFLMETDDAWMRALEPVLSRYGHVTRHPQPKAFGLAFATRLRVLKANVVENTHRDTPTVYATVQHDGSPPIEFIGLHPKPPLPGWNTELRDRNIVSAGIQTPDRLPDAFVMGDFNDVPWSRTTTKFREAGGWGDPRIGRGSFPTFPADLVLLGWPLDQIMVKGQLKVASFAVLPDNGSDHRAILAWLCAPQSVP